MSQGLVATYTLSVILCFHCSTFLCSKVLRKEQPVYSLRDIERNEADKIIEDLDVSRNLCILLNVL